METPSPHPISRALEALDAGDTAAEPELLPLLYAELRQLAGTLMGKMPPGQTLQPTALVHETYLRLVGKTDRPWQSRGYFFAAAARAMRDILVEQARRKAAQKRGGDRKRLPLDDQLLRIDAPSENMLALDEALRKLEEDDSRKGRIVDLRFFAGLSVPEIAAALGISERTVKREWRYARAWLHKELDGGVEEDHQRDGE